jgi:hypothetical protein
MMVESSDSLSVGKWKMIMEVHMATIGGKKRAFSWFYLNKTQNKQRPYRTTFLAIMFWRQLARNKKIVL